MIERMNESTKPPTNFETTVESVAWDGDMGRSRSRVEIIERGSHLWTGRVEVTVERAGGDGDAVLNEIPQREITSRFAELLGDLLIESAQGHDLLSVLIVRLRSGRERAMQDRTIAQARQDERNRIAHGLRALVTAKNEWSQPGVNIFLHLADMVDGGDL